MSEFKVTPLKPKDQHDESSESNVGVAEPEATDQINPAELRQEHEERIQHQHESAKGLDRETILHILYQMILIRRIEKMAVEAYKLV